MRSAVGDEVTAVGNAGGTGTLTAARGTVSSLKASVTTAAEGSLSSETLKTMIETTADVVAGDSGGPLYDSEGEIVGIDTAASSGSEIDGYAIPIERALSIVRQIRSGEETSTVQIGPAPFLGVELASADSGVGSGYFDTSCRRRVGRDDRWRGRRQRRGPGRDRSRGRDREGRRPDRSPPPTTSRLRWPRTTPVTG